MQINSINRTTVINILSTVILDSIAFFTTPIFTRLLGAEQYGVYAVYLTWVSIFQCFMGLGMGSSLNVGRYHFREKYPAFRSGILLCATLCSVLLIGFVSLFLPLLSSLLHFDRLMIFLMLLHAFFSFIVGFVRGDYVYGKKAQNNFLLSMILTFSTVLLSICFIQRKTFAEPYLGRVYGNLIPYALVGSAVWLLTFFKRPDWPRKAYILFSFPIGYPIIFHTLAHSILGQSDRVMLRVFGILDAEIGIYSLFYSLNGVLTALLSALNTSWCPFYFDDLDTENWSSLKRKSKNYVELFTVICFGFLMLAREVTYLMAESEFWNGVNLLPVLAFGAFFTLMYQFAVNFEFFCKKTQLIAVGTILSGLLNIALNALMIPLWGMYGAAIATVFSYAALFLFHYHMAGRIREQPFYYPMMPLLCGLSALAAGALLFFVWKDFPFVRWTVGALAGFWELSRMKKRKSIF